jgi:hydrophobe/amphiphile efflux-1 (HAE1) family protein
MNISAPFIRRPVATSLLTLALLLSGIVAYRLLAVAPLPQVDYPVVSVGAALPGASPDTVASSIATPLERQFGRIAGINQMTSVSQVANTNIIMQFDLARDINGASRDVQAAINAARGQLPTDLPRNPTWRQTNPAEAPLMVLALTSDTATQQEKFDAADSILAQKLQQIEGMGVVNIGGSSQPAVRIEVNPLMISKLGVSLEQVRIAVNAANANIPKGAVSLDGHKSILADNDQLFFAKDYAKLIVAYNKATGSPVRLGDVATVIDDQSNILNTGYINSKVAVTLTLYRIPGANIIEVADRVRALIPELRASIPPSINLDISQDRTVTIRASVADVETTLMIAVGLVVIVVFAFLRSGWATVIPSIAVPLSLVGTFSVMYLAGYSIDNLSLMALTISTGFVVDDAIVVIENITRYLEKGMRPIEAALRGSQEIGFTVLSMSISLIAVFIPILMMSGIVGRIFREFAVTLSVAVAISMVVSLTTTPMMCSRLLRPEEHNKKHNFLARASIKSFDWMYERYASSLGWVLEHQRTTLTVMLGTVCLAVYLYVIIPKGFFPHQDTGRITGQVLASQDTSFQKISPMLKQFVDILMQDPAIDVAAASTGNRTNVARIDISLKPLNQRKISADQIINRLRPKLARVPGGTLFLQPVQDVQIGGRVSNAEFQYTLEGDNTKDLLDWGPRVLTALRNLPELRDINSDAQSNGLMAGLVIDRDTASRLGVTPSTIDNLLYDGFGQRQISIMYKGINQYPVVMEMARNFQQSPDALKNIYVPSNVGTPIPLSAFTHSQASNVSIAVNHQGQFPAVTFSFNLGLGVPLGDAVAAIKNVERTLGMPSTIHPGFQGTAQAFQDSLRTEPYLILAALVAVYIVLGILYENYIHPITILSTLPSAGVGALLALMLFHTELTVIALVGIILLIGIVKKNAIMMIDFALDAERNEGLSPENAIHQACLLRFRPIMMTTVAAMFGGLPMALGTGTGSELRRPLGIAIVGGLIVSQMLTLYTTPVVYLYLDRLRAWLSGGKSLRRLDTPPMPASTD